MLARLLKHVSLLEMLMVLSCLVCNNLPKAKACTYYTASLICLPFARCAPQPQSYTEKNGVYTREKQRLHSDFYDFTVDHHVEFSFGSYLNQ